MGKIAAQQLLNLLRGQGHGRLVQIPFALQIRESTAAAPQ
jgi:LacI family transcriptional regulator